jgi:RNA polymerase sigma factor (TIGR02999 family)
MADSPAAITELLQAWRDGDAAARPRLADVLYAELRRMARRRLGTFGGGIDPTELVNEAYLRLCENDVDWRNRAHFYALAALHMRNVLVDGARERQSAKRGGRAALVTLGAGEGQPVESGVDLLQVDEALTALAAEDERTARVLEWTYFSGMDRNEIAFVEGISVPTVDRCLRYGRARLKTMLQA